MNTPCNLFDGSRVPLLVLKRKRRGGRHECTAFKSVDRCNIIDVYGGVSSFVALQSFVGLRFQRTDGCHLGRFRDFKNHQIYLKRPFFEEER